MRQPEDPIAIRMPGGKTAALRCGTVFGDTFTVVGDNSATLFLPGRQFGAELVPDGQPLFPTRGSASVIEGVGKRIDEHGIRVGRSTAGAVFATCPRFTVAPAYSGECSECHGTGCVTCPHCDNDDAECSECDGEGRVDLPAVDSPAEHFELRGAFFDTRNLSLLLRFVPPDSECEVRVYKTAVVELRGPRFRLWCAAVSNLAVEEMAAAKPFPLTEEFK